MDRLFLNEWIITAKMASNEEFSLPERSGEISMDFEGMEAVIRILKPEEFPKDAITKYCAELILIHELLHCKYNWLVAGGTYEGRYVDVMEHQKLEQMSKTLIMVKYGLPLEWFVNRKKKEE